jgi:hypothetical protein
MNRFLTGCYGWRPQTNAKSTKRCPHIGTKAATFSSGLDGFGRAASLRTYEKEPHSLVAVDQIARRNQRKAQLLEAESHIQWQGIASSAPRLGFESNATQG